MDNKKVLVITDIHFGCRNNNALIEKEITYFFEELVIPFIKNNSIKTVFILGDVFENRKIINIKTISVAKNIFNSISSLVDNIYCLLGNHDVYYKDTIEVSSVPLIFNDIHNMTIIDKPISLTIHERNIGFVPWICSSNEKDCLDFIKRIDVDVLCGHFNFSSFEMNKGEIIKEGLNPSLVERFNMVLSGHYHHKSSKESIHYLGNGYETTWGEANDVKGFHVLDLNDVSLHFIENTRKLHITFYFDEYKHGKNLDLSLFQDKFVKIVTDKVDEDVAVLFNKIVSDIDSVCSSYSIVYNIQPESSMYCTDDIVNNDMTVMVNKYIDMTVDDKSKDRIKTLFHELYHDAKNKDH